MNAIELFLISFVTTFSILVYIDRLKESARVIGENYLTRYFIIPRNRWFNVYLHKYTGSDDDRAHHDHPWPSVSFLIKGNLIEHTKRTVCDPAGIGRLPQVCIDIKAKKQIKYILPKY